MISLLLLFKFFVITVLLFWSLIIFKKVYLVHFNLIFQFKAFLVMTLHAHLFYVQ